MRRAKFASGVEDVGFGNEVGGEQPRMGCLELVEVGCCGDHGARGDERVIRGRLADGLCHITFFSFKIVQKKN